MKQIIQNVRSGALELVEVPAPMAGPGQLLVRTAYSVMSPGTEKLALEFARKTLLGKARSRPELVGQVLRKLRHEGPLPTYRAVMNRLDAPQPLGYSSAGIVEVVGSGVTGYASGDRVACAGAGYASHAEVVAVPENLVVHVPDGVALEHAAFSTLGAIALQGLRVGAPVLGEIAVVVGLGLIGQLTVQLLCASGCRVLGIDLDPVRTKQARDLGAEWSASPTDDLEMWRAQATASYGADLVVMTASADSAAPLQLASELCRMKGRISVVGAVPMTLDRRLLYEKELELRMSMSYGPGRYDRAYEEDGHDYPLPYVRWTENRNLQAFLHAIATGTVRPDSLDTETIAFEDAPQAYEGLAKGQRHSLATVFRYVDVPRRDRVLILDRAATVATRRRFDDGAEIGVAFLGAGNYAKAVLLPALGRVRGVRRAHLVTATGASARHSAERFGFAACGTDPDAALRDPGVDLVVIATRHDTHAQLAVQALRASKAVWLEKPVGLTPEAVDDVAGAMRETGGFLAVGYNRRFSRHARAVREAFTDRSSPLSIHYVVSAGPPPSGWIVDPRTGGGRIIGEVCHFVDLCRYLVGASPVSVYARALGRDPAADDSVVALIGYSDGSTAAIEYLSRANSDLPKERFEASADGRTASCDNYRVTHIRGLPRLVRVKTLNQDKGQSVAVTEIIEAVRGERTSPFSLDEIVSASRTTFAMLESLRTGRPVELLD